jgi:hypothetical protein
MRRMGLRLTNKTYTWSSVTDIFLKYFVHIIQVSLWCLMPLSTIFQLYFKYGQYYIESSSGCFCLYNMEGPSCMLLYGSWIYNLPVQSVPITTKVVSDLLRFPPPIKLTKIIFKSTVRWNYPQCKFSISK